MPRTFASVIDSDVDMAYHSGRNPWKDILDLVVRQRHTIGSAHDSKGRPQPLGQLS